jgi:hypothetical protein
LWNYLARRRRSSRIKQAAASPLHLHKVVQRFSGNSAVSMMNFGRVCVACFAQTYCLLNQLCIKPPLPGRSAWSSRCSAQIPGHSHTHTHDWRASKSLSRQLFGRRFFCARGRRMSARRNTRSLTYACAPRCCRRLFLLTGIG